MDSQRTAFGTVLFGGFNKDDVYQYIEQLVIDHKTECKRYDHQIFDLESEIARMAKELEKISAERDTVVAESEKLKDENAAVRAELEALKASAEDAE